ncbi:hypothetical protein [Pedobacter jeongneungensis]|uniref:hypothetical protein n=1 Tax=Pedobacter jeongneungensis TaxID=947309 RepID=UPI0004699CEA|nr:hypothetical protein [Pedobacter jeongneungensis]
MKKLTLLLIMGIALLSCKKNKTTSECGDKICTQELASVVIRFVDNKGEGAEVKDFSVINQRTGESLKANSSIYTSTVKGAFIVIDDGNKSQLSEGGDDLKITGTSATTNQAKSVVIKASGGKCACHIKKITGPDQVTFD